MAEKNISPNFPFTLQRVKVLDAEMAYVDTAPNPTSQEKEKPVLLFLHGNPTSSYLWRNIIPHVSNQTRCIAPDLIGMGASDKLPHLSYRFIDHALYLDEFISTIIPRTQAVVPVLHDWGSGLGFHWARRHAYRIAGLAFMEFVKPMSWKHYGPAEGLFRAIRGPPDVGRKLVIEENFFVDKLLAGGVMRGLTEEEMEHYRAPYIEPSSREPLYRWPNEIPVEGEPKDVAAIVETYHAWLLKTEVPKLFFHATPGAIINEELASYYMETLKNVTSVNIGAGQHWLQEENPHLIGAELAKWMHQVILGEVEKG